MKFESANRLTYKFKRLVSDRKYDNVVLSSMHSNISKNVYIRTKNMKDNADEMDYFLEKMNIMGDSTLELLNNRPKVIANTNIKKDKKDRKRVSGIMGSLSAAIIPMMFMGGSMVMSSKAHAAPTKTTNNLKTSIIKPPEKEDNIFGITSKDKYNLRQLNIKGDSETSILDKITKITSSGFISSFGGLVFGYKSFKDSLIYKNFKDNLHAYSTEVYEIFNKVIKNIFLWVRENIITPINDIIDIPKNIFIDLKDKVLASLNNMLGISDNSTDINEDSKKTKDTNRSILTSIKSMLVKYIGSGKFTSKVLKRISKNKDKKSNTKKKDSVRIDAGVQDPEFADFNGMPLETSLSTPSGMQLGVYAALRRAGFSDRQSRIFTAEIGREGSYKASNIFGVHGDPKNGYANIGMISWQKDRNPRLVKWMTDAGLMHGKTMVRTQAAIDMQAKFIMHEIVNDPTYKRTKNQFLANPNISYSAGKEILGNNYIVWVYTNSNHSGHKNRDFFYSKINKQLDGQGDSDDDGDKSPQDTKLKGTEKPLTLADTAVLSDYNIELEYEAINRRNKKYSPGMFLGQSPYKPEQTQSPNRINTAIAPIKTSKPQGAVDNNSGGPKSGGPQKNRLSLFEILMNKDISGSMLN